SGSSGSGNGTVTYSVSANTSSSSRNATITVAGKTHTVSQAGVPCTYSISPTSNSFTASGGTGSISVTSSASDCTWNATEGVSWITITSGTKGSGNGTVTYSVSANTSSSSRNATITVAGKAHTVSQAAPLPDYTITSLSLSTDSVLAGLTVNVTYTARNQGGPPSNCVNMAIFLSTNSTITTYDTQLVKWGLPNCNLNAGQSITQTWQVTIPANTATGYYYIGIIADVDQYETESNEGNNTAARQIYVYQLL
ncbi:MAG: CARDB domain-containing protein, partial [Desulfobacterales bacterium]